MRNDARLVRRLSERVVVRCWHLAANWATFHFGERDFYINIRLQGTTKILFDKPVCIYRIACAKNCVLLIIESDVSI